MLRDTRARLIKKMISLPSVDAKRFGLACIEHQDIFFIEEGIDMLLYFKNC